jgi:hypothetical protein
LFDGIPLILYIIYDVLYNSLARGLQANPLRWMDPTLKPTVLDSESPLLNSMLHVFREKTVNIFQWTR